jgi:hypothetical protein
MGDYILMKNIKIIALAALMSTISYAEFDLSWVDKQIDAIQPERTGIQDENINAIKEPFIFLSEEANATKSSPAQTVTKVITAKDGTTQQVVVKLEPLKLTAIINKNALIDKKWYKLNDKIRDSKIIAIEKDYVVLKDRYNKKFKLYISTKSENIEINVK